MHDEMNRKTASGIAQTIRPWSSTNDCKRLEELVFTALQIAEKRGEVVEKHRSSNNAVRGAAEPRTLDGLVGLPNGGGR